MHITEKQSTTRYLLNVQKEVNNKQLKFNPSQLI